MSACAVAQAADASLVASESMERPTAVKLTMLFSTFFHASNASASAGAIAIQPLMTHGSQTTARLQASSTAQAGLGSNFKTDSICRGWYPRHSLQ